MKKYIVNFVGVTARPNFSFKRSVDFYENSDGEFVAKLLHVLRFKNRDADFCCVADDHCELVESITKVVLDSDDNEEIHNPEDFGKFTSVNKRNLKKLVMYWHDGDPSWGRDFDFGIRDYESEERMNEVKSYYQSHIDCNLLIH